MNVRHILVAASAAAILAGSSFGALAGSHNFSKGESKSSVATAAFFYYTPVAINLQKEHTTAFVKGNGEAAAGAGTTGGAIALQGAFSFGSGGGGGGGVQALSQNTSPSGGFSVSGYGQVAAAWGSTSGSSAAGNGANNNGNVGNPE